MEDELSQRRLAAIVAIDVVGYSARAAANEDGAVAEIAGLGDQIAAACARFGGRVFNTAGDGFMLEFPTVSGAVEAADQLATTAQVPIRVGVHLGEVRVSASGDLLGHGVNVAARLQAHAAPGSVLVSSDVRRATLGKLAERLTPRGSIRLDATGETMAVFALAGAGGGRAARSRRPGLRRSQFLGLGAACLVVLGLAAAFLLWRQRSAQAQDVALAPFQTDGGAAARAFAAGLSYEVAGSVANAGVKVIAPDGRGAGAANLVLGGRIESAGADLRLATELQDAHSHAVLWSANFTGAADKPAALEEEVAAKLTDVLHCALDVTNYPGGRIAPGTLQTYLRACDLEHSDTALDQVRDLYHQVALQQPGFSRPWSRFAYAGALAAFGMQPEQARAARQEARQAARTSLRINPKDGLAYEALADAGLGELSWAQIYRLFEDGLAVEPDNAKLLDDESQLLLRTGRINAAIQLETRSLALDPFSPGARTALIVALLDGRRIDEARAALERSLRIWPQDQALRGERIDLEARYGDAARARALLNDPGLRPTGWSEARSGRVERLIRARGGDERTLRAFVKDELADFEGGRLDADAVIVDLNNVGATEAAFRVAETIASNAPRSTPADAHDPEFIWRSFSDAFRRDPRFMRLAARFGLTDFWRSTGLWPDFCSIPNWPYDCRALAAKDTKEVADQAASRSPAPLVR